MHRQDQRADAFLTGRRTYEDLRSYWPKQTDDPTGITAYLNHVRKYVVSSTLQDPEWEPTVVLCHALIEAGLVDEYRLFTYPVVQGRGRRLFPDGVEAPRLRLLDAQRSQNGVTYAAYGV